MKVLQQSIIAVAMLAGAGLIPAAAADDKKLVLITSEEAARVIPLDGLRQEAHGGMIGVSALTGEGIPQLLTLIENRLSAHSRVYDITIAISDGAALSWLHAHGKVHEQRDTKTKAHLKVELDAADYGRFERRFLKK